MGTDPAVCAPGDRRGNNNPSSPRLFAGDIVLDAFRVRPLRRRMASLFVSDLDWTPRLARSICRRHGLSLTERGEVVRDGEVVATYELAARDVGPAWPPSRLAAGARPPPEAGRMRRGPSRVPLRAIATFVGLPEPAIRRALCFAEWLASTWWRPSGRCWRGLSAQVASSGSPRRCYRTKPSSEGAGKAVAAPTWPGKLAPRRGLTSASTLSRSETHVYERPAVLSGATRYVYSNSLPWMRCRLPPRQEHFRAHNWPSRGIVRVN